MRSYITEGTFILGRVTGMKHFNEALEWDCNDKTNSIMLKILKCDLVFLGRTMDRKNHAGHKTIDMLLYLITNTGKIWIRRSITFKAQGWY